ncbi:hypothetical protein ACHQM5_010681 [Ranunculus cassubicifolius]
MAESTKTPTTETPLLTHQQSRESTEEFTDTQLSKTIKHLQTFLYITGFHQSSPLSISLSWIGFIIVGVILPALIIEISSCSRCSKYLVSTFEYYILVFQGVLAAVSLLCISHIVRRHGLRNFLFVDRQHGRVTKFHQQYTAKIQSFFRLLILCTGPCFILKIILEVVRNVYMYSTWWKSIGIMLASVISWTYLTTVSLSASLLFNLVCNLQIIHFDDYEKLLESDSDVSECLKEHMRLKHYLCKISHRFRIYLLLEFLIVTASQLFILFQTTGDHGILDVLNGGNFAVISIAQLVGIVLSLHAAAKFSHRAQGIASVASRWHAIVTCSDIETSQSGVLNSSGNLDSLYLNFSESDMESSDPVILPTNTQMPSYHKRQSLVMYLQSNLGGVTIFGWTIDRVLINTVFFVELSLVSFVLGKTLIYTAT